MDPINIFQGKALLVSSFWLLSGPCAAQRPAPASLTFAALEHVVKECSGSGKIATDYYCKQAQAVYEPKLLRMKEAERLARVHAQGAASHADVGAPIF